MNAVTDFSLEFILYFIPLFYTFIQWLFRGVIIFYHNLCWVQETIYTNREDHFQVVIQNIMWISWLRLTAHVQEFDWKIWFTHVEQNLFAHVDQQLIWVGVIRKAPFNSSQELRLPGKIQKCHELLWILVLIHPLQREPLCEEKEAMMNILLTTTLSSSW